MERPLLFGRSWIMPNYRPADSSYQYCAKRFVQVALPDIEAGNFGGDNAKDYVFNGGLQFQVFYCNRWLKTRLFMGAFSRRG
jgi:hypothetical protein